MSPPGPTTTAGLARGELAAAIRALVQAREPAAEHIRVEALEPLGGGNARRAWSVDLAWSVSGQRRQRACVMLIQEEAGQLESDLAREFRLLVALRESGVPAPRALWLDAAGDFVGAPSFLMTRLPGSADLGELLRGDRAGRSRALALQMASAAAALHRAPVETRDLGALEVPTRDQAAQHQIRSWERLFLEHRMEPLPILVEAFAWLREHAPSAERIAIVHGDFRFGNILYEGNRLRALLDWEMAHLGDPCEDLAWAYHPLWSPSEFLEFDAFVAAYEAAARCRLSRFVLHYYRLFTEVKHAVISLTGAHAFASGRTPHLRLADRMTWVPECMVEFRRLLRQVPARELGA